LHHFYATECTRRAEVNEETKEILDRLNEALILIKKLPIRTYGGPPIVGAMINIETTIDAIENW
jgi:hypothetical protein